jgi:hypothetical protein
MNLIQVKNGTFGLRNPAVEEMRDVRFGSKADVTECPTNVRFAPKSGH